MIEKPLPWGVGSRQVEFAAAGYVIDVQGIAIPAAMGFEDPGP
jgi:hypothetical protein